MSSSTASSPWTAAQTSIRLTGKMLHGRGGTALTLFVFDVLAIGAVVRPEEICGDLPEKNRPSRFVAGW